jgi:4-amino-4-deoxy-L-arabinose transferase-like glycosyltransferase
MPWFITILLTTAAAGLGGLLWWQLQLRHRFVAGRRPNLFLVLLLAGIACRLAYWFLTPTFYAPDEQAHFNYIKFIAEQGEFPVLTTKMGDPSHEWEYFQPPLYYLALAPVFALTKLMGFPLPATVLLLRGFSFLLWLLNLWCGIVLLNRLQITDRVVRTFALGALCLLPTYTFSSTAINNDNLLIALSGLLLCVLAQRVYHWKNAVLTGLLLGAALLTKKSAVVFIPVILTLTTLEAWKRQITMRTALSYLTGSLGLAFLIYLPWLVRTWQTYQTLTPELLSGDLKTWPSFAYGCASAIHNLVQSFWAVSGISNDVGYPFPLLGILFLVACVGAGQIELRRSRSFDPLHRQWNRPLLLAFGIGVLVNVLLVLRFGYLFGMGQGRHLFPLLVPIALGLGSWMRNWKIPKLEVHAAGCWLLYALTFAAYSLTRFPRLK